MTGPAGALRILVVEDEPALVSIMRFSLELAGHVVRIAGNGVEALRTLGAESFDLVLCDLAMPEMNGYELYCRTRESEGRRVPFLFCTGHSTLPFTRPLPQGILGVVEKPFSVGDLTAAIERVRPHLMA